MAWVSDQSGSSGVGNKEAATQSERYFLDGGVHPQTVITEPESLLDIHGNRLPPIGSPHPFNPGIFLDSYKADCTGKITVAIAQYSHDGRFALPPIDVEPNAETIVGYESSFEQVQVRIPYAERTPIVVPVVGPPTSDGLPALTRTTGWTPKFRQISEWRFTQTWTVLITEDDRDRANAAIWSQQDRLHKIYGVWYRYRGSGLVETGEKRNGRKVLRLRHSWTRDAGTLFPTNVSEDFYEKFFVQLWPVSLLEPSQVFFNPGWMRPPFQSVTFTNADSILNTPDAHLVLDFPVGKRAINGVDGDGWKDLPGTNG